jgi:hypothetical protein
MGSPVLNPPLYPLSYGPRDSHDSAPDPLLHPMSLNLSR